MTLSVDHLQGINS